VIREEGGRGDGKARSNNSYKEHKTREERKPAVIQIKPQLGNIIDESKRDGVGDSGVAVMLNRVTSSLGANKIIRRLLISSQIQENGGKNKRGKKGRGRGSNYPFLREISSNPT
jgi:hypothetical protein